MRAATPVLVVALLAGCAAAPEFAIPATVEGVVEGLDAPLEILAPAPGAPADLSAPPLWRTGEWWTYRLADAYTREEREITLVVAGAAADRYLVGLSSLDDVPLLMHVPPIGDLSRADLSYDVHDELFQILKFPMVDGDTWEAVFEGGAVAATTTVTGPATAEVAMTGAFEIRVSYDAADARGITAIHIENYADIDLVAHGFDHVGPVRVPYLQDLVLLHYRLAGALGPGNAPGLPADSADVAEGYDGLSAAILLGTLLPSTDAPTAVYRERVVAPDGQEWEETVTPADRPGLHIFPFHHDAPAGTWTFEHVAAGPGIAAIEGVAYKLLDVTLPLAR